MSDYDRNKFFRRTKFYSTQRESGHTSQCNRGYNKGTLFKYDRDSDKTTDAKEKTVQQPTILLKAKSERSLSPKRSTKENEPATTSATIAAHETVSIPTPVMTEPVKLIEDGSILSESFQEYLQDSPDFLVVGVLGSQGVGKSTIMNLIAQSKLNDQIIHDLLNYSGTQNQSDSIKLLTENISHVKLNADDPLSADLKSSGDKNVIFKPQTFEKIEIGSYGTSGVDLYITSNRVFLLDCQPVISAAILDEVAQNDFKRTIAGEYLPTENCAEIHSLQLATFILSVCHIVILVQDWFLDSNFVRFLQTTEMLKPSIPMGDEDFMEYFPHVILVHNRSTLEDFTPMRFKMIQNVYRDVFSKSKLRFESGMGLGTGKIIHNLNPITCDDPLNLFLLPEYDEENDSKYHGHPPFEDLVRELRAQIHSVTRVPLFSAQLTERNWLQFSTRVWETIRKSSFFLEYSKLMP